MKKVNIVPIIFILCLLFFTGFTISNFPATNIMNLHTAQLVEHCSANAEAMGLNPAEALNFSGLICHRLNRTITWLLSGTEYICGPSSIICARAERGCKWCYEGHKCTICPTKDMWLSLLSIHKFNMKSCCGLQIPFRARPLPFGPRKGAF